MTKKKKKKSHLQYEDIKIKLDLNPDTSREIGAVITGLLAIFILFSLINWLGSVGQIIKTVLLIAFGFTAYSIPFALLYFTLNILLPDKYTLHVRQAVSIFILYITIPGFLNLLGPADEINYGGYIGRGLIYLSEAVIGFQGTVILLIALLVIAYLLFFNTSLQFIFTQINRLLPRFRSPKFSQDNVKINTFSQHNPPAQTSQPETTPEPELEEIPSSETDNTSDRKTVSIAETEEKPSAITEEEPDIDWQLPPTSLLENSKSEIKSGNIDQNVKIIQQTLAQFNIDVEMKDVNIGPTVTQYTFKPDAGVKLSKITSLQNDLALALAAHPVRVEAPIPGKALVGIEIPNKKPASVRLKDILESDVWQNNPSRIPIPLGRDITGAPIIDDLTKMPHLLIAGSTGSGKSVFINSTLISLLTRFTPNELKFILVDPKRVELTTYNKIPHLLTPVITEPKNALNGLKWAITEMNNRYRILSEAKTRNIHSYNQNNPGNKLPYIIIVIDELADLMMTAGNDIETAICRIAQMARATGIHLIVATQRPSVDVITGLIKANIATRIAFAVASQVDSRTILDMSGAEKLLGKGDMLYVSRESGKLRRIQGVLTSDQEIENITKFLSDEGPAVNFFTNLIPDEITEDPVTKQLSFSDVEDDLFGDVVDLVISTQQASASFLQRKLKIGYARAARLVDILEQKNIISPQIGNKPRQVLIKSLDDLKE